MISDLCHAARALLRRPAFAGAVVATLALTIGANVAIFAAIYAMLLRPLPFPDADRLVAIEVEGGGGVGKLAGREVRDIARDSQTIADFATFYPSQYNITGGGLPESLVTMIGTSNLFRVFGVRMLHGETWSPAIDWTSGQYTVVLSHALWQQRYGSDPSIVGRSVKLDGADYLVTGVLPPGFDYPVETRLYRAVSGYTTSSARRFTGVARLKPGVTLASARGARWLQHAVRSTVPGDQSRIAIRRASTPGGLRRFDRAVSLAARRRRRVRLAAGLSEHRQSDVVAHARAAQ